jgi:hypothetical protein
VPHRQSPTAPLSHQDGPMQDPFITIQTATSVISPPRARDEGGIPLGRTSHAERILAARTLATQQLGLGMPGRNPSPVKAPLQPRARDEDAQSESGSEGESREIMFDSSFDMVSRDEAPPPRGSSMAWGASNGSSRAETPKRGLPKPPAPRVEQVRLPSPVSRRAPEPEKKVEKRVSAQRLVEWGRCRLTSPGEQARLLWVLPPLHWQCIPLLLQREQRSGPRHPCTGRQILSLGQVRFLGGGETPHSASAHG